MMRGASDFERGVLTALNRPKPRELGRDRAAWTLREGWWCESGKSTSLISEGKSVRRCSIYLRLSSVTTLDRRNSPVAADVAGRVLGERRAGRGRLVTCRLPDDGRVNAQVV